MNQYQAIFAIAAERARLATEYGVRPMRTTLIMNDNGDGTVTTQDSRAEIGVTIKARRKVGPWRGNNRRTDFWFKFEGVAYWGWCDESRTIFTARKVKG